MRFIKLALISFVLLFLLITAMSLLLPSTINISRAIDINAPLDSIHNNLNDLSRWKNWYANYDSSAVTLSESQAGKGASIRMYTTTITILQSSTQKIATRWQAGNKTLESDFNLYRQPDTSVITVQWHFTQQLKWYPWEKFASIVTDKRIGPVLEKSLENLKTLVER